VLVEDEFLSKFCLGSGRCGTWIICVQFVEELMFNHLAMGKHALNLLCQRCVLLTPLSEGRSGRCNHWSNLGGCVQMVVCIGRVTVGGFIQNPWVT